MKKIILASVALAALGSTQAQAFVRASTIELIVSIKRGDYLATHNAIEGGAPMHEQIGTQRQTPLMIAVHELGKSLKNWFVMSVTHQLRLEIVKDLIRASSQEVINARDAEGKTALEILYSYALELGNRNSYYSDILKQVELLLAHKANGNEQRI